jgi:hypothetical protein
MIPVRKKPEPENFDELVRTPGREFLEKVPAPTTKQWKRHEYWKEVLGKMGQSYRWVCAYSALWVPPVTGARTIDHFVPKSTNPALAYEWDNFRYASATMNSRKGTKTIIDPFTLKPGWFEMDFEQLEVKPNPTLSPENAEVVRSTIKILKLDKDEEYKNACQNWVMNYCRGDITFKFLKAAAPFIAYELERKGLKKKIARMMKYPSNDNETG